VNELWPPDIGYEYEQRKNVALDPQKDALRGDINSPYFTHEKIHPLEATY
jgi:hypothetical protein